MTRLLTTLTVLAIATAMTSCDGRSETDAGVDGGGQPDSGSDDAATPEDGGTDAQVPVECGNGVIDGIDECDGAALGGMGCEDVLGAGGVGMLGCNDDCTLDVTMCSVCGDDTIEGSEACDGEVPGGMDCASALGAGATGTLDCSSTCTLDTSMCQRCGNAAAEGTEACDGADLADATCASRGFDGGALACTSACAFDESACFECGDGAIGGTEDCDGTSLGGATCASEGFDGGTLACIGCAFDTSACFGCGDGTRNGTEACDGADLGGADCASRTGFDGGTLGCTTACIFDESACTACGDGAAEGTEECDLTDLRGATCASRPGFASGTLRCGGTCAFDTSSCSAAAPPAAGQVVITEIMPDPSAVSDASGEWFEVQNTGAAAVNLQGCIVHGAAATGDRFTIIENLVIEAGAYATFASSASPGFTPTYSWTPANFLVNGGDSVIIECGGVPIDAVAYDATFPLLPGISMTFGPPSPVDATMNDDAARWCLARSTYGGGDRGTPGAANDRCAWPIGFCRVQFPDTIATTPGANTTVYGRVYAAGLTDQTGVADADILLAGMVGVGPDGSDPATAAGWTWTLAVPNGGYGPGSPAYEMNNDEYSGELTAPPAAGGYDYAFRFSGNNGIDWVYCDTGAAGSSDGYAPADAGQMSVTAPPIAITPGSITIAPTGGTAVLQVRLPTPAGPGGVSVTLGSSSPDIAAPASVVIPEGHIQAGIRVRAVASSGSAMISATVGTDTAMVGVAIGGAMGAIPGELRINEILYNTPATTAEGDANCSGGGSVTASDEFVELINVSAHPIQLGGVSIWEEANWMGGAGTVPRFTIPAEILGPGEAFVVYGGGRGTAPITGRPWCDVVTATHTGDARAINGANLGLNDTVDSVFLTLTNTPTVLLESVSFTTEAIDQSFARSPDGTGAFVAFTSIAGRATDRLFSPGTLSSGLGFALASAP